MEKNNIHLEQIIPEYNSRNPLVRWLFSKRLTIAIDFLIILNSQSHLDIGCGNGKFIEYIQSTGLSINSLSAMDTNKNVIHLNNKYKPASGDYLGLIAKVFGAKSLML